MATPDYATALQQTGQLAKQKGYGVEPDGRVFTLKDGKKSYVPPWLVWQGEQARLPDGSINPLVLPGSDPNSAWHSMFSAGGPFTNQSTWDPEKGTYEGSIDWLQLLTTIGAGAVIGGGVAAAVGGSGGPAATTATIPTTASSSAPVALGGTGTAMNTGGLIPTTLASPSTLAVAGGSSALWANPKLWQGIADIGTNAVGTYLDNRGRQQAAETQQQAAQQAGQYSQQATQNALGFAQQMQANTQPWLHPSPGSARPTFAQLAPAGPALRTGASMTGRIGYTDPAIAPSGQGAESGTGAAATGSAVQPAPTATYLQSLIAGGMTPQDAIAKFNQETGRKTGNEAVYYGPEVHGKATIGLPEAYLADNGQGQWDIVQRTPERPNGNLGGGMPNFAQLMGGAGMGGAYSAAPMNPYQAPPPGAMQAPRPMPNFAQLMTMPPRVAYLPMPAPAFNPYQTGPRM